MASVTDSATGVTTKYYYDFTSRLLAYEEAGNGHSLRVGYSYDIHNNLTGLSQTVNGVERVSSYTYDDDNRVTSVTADGVTVEYTYDALGRVSQQVTKQGETTVLTESFTYTTKEGQTSAQIATYTTATAAGTTTYSYTYDGNGNILSVSDGTNTTSYVYDKQNQLIRENNQAGGFTHTWAYNDAGNIQTRTEYAHTIGTLGTATDTITYTYGDASWGDLLTAYDGTAITYDGMGNPNALDGWSFTWEHGRELATMSNGTNTWTNTYNADGLRTKRTNGSTTYSYVYTGSTLLSMSVGNDILYFNYDAAGIPLTVSWNGTTYYYATNLQGDVVAILDGSGNTVVSYTYDAWGNPISTTGTLASTLGTLNPLRYRGYVYDNETGLYYLQSRYYNPRIGRFINADDYTTTNQGFVGNNMFAYCGNNPIVFVDATGYYYSRTEIHNFVLDDICKKYPAMSRHNTYIKYKTPRLFRSYGFCDLYHTQTGEVWEAKRFGGSTGCSKIAATTQLESYVRDGILVANPTLKLRTGGTFTAIEPDVFEVPDKDMEGTYIIAYWDAGDGVIFYDYVYEPASEELGHAVIGTLALAALLGLAFLTGGATAGALLPA